MTEQEIDIEEEQFTATDDVVEVKTQNRFQKIIETVLRFFGIAEWISYAQVMHNFLFVVAIVGIGVLEIFNTHLAVKLNRSITEKENNIK
ncbi:MAG TPA: hypothetical protein PK431_15395, partial [Chitinophagales bacterium]|nr:hypothetical protein [Chitinophagales bacterium]